MGSWREAPAEGETSKCRYPLREGQRCMIQVLTALLAWLLSLAEQWDREQ